jgi:hypothetical protein
MTVMRMKGHVPHWLPEGFGLAGTWELGDSAWATWTDDQCREVTVSVEQGRADATPGPRIGAWTVTVDVPAACSNSVLGTATCLGYQANATMGSVGIQAMGIERQDGDAIVQSIPL